MKYYFYLKRIFRPSTDLQKSIHMLLFDFLGDMLYENSMSYRRFKVITVKFRAIF